MALESKLIWLNEKLQIDITSNDNDAISEKHSSREVSNKTSLRPENFPIVETTSHRLEEHSVKTNSSPAYLSKVHPTSKSSVVMMKNRETIKSLEERAAQLELMLHDEQVARHYNPGNMTITSPQGTAGGGNIASYTFGNTDLISGRAVLGLQSSKVDRSIKLKSLY